MAKEDRAKLTLEQTRVDGIRAKLDNKDFVAFLDRYEDDLDPGDAAGAEEVEKRFETFELSRKAGAELKNLYKDRIKADLDVKLTDAEMTEVAEYVEREVMTNPEGIRELADGIAEFKRQEALIGDREAELEELMSKTGGRRALERKQTVLDAARRSVGEQIPLLRRFLKPTEDQKLARETLEKSYGISVKDIDREREKVAEQRQPVERLEQFRAIRERIFGDVGPARAVFERARGKAHERIKQLADPSKPPGDWQKAMDELADLREASKSGPVDYLEGYDQKVFEGEEVKHLDAKAVERALEERIDDYVGTMIAEAVGKHATFSPFERAMRDITKKERIGKKIDDEKRTFIRETLEAQLPKVSTAKKMFIRTFLASFNKEAS